MSHNTAEELVTGRTAKSAGKVAAADEGPPAAQPMAEIVALFRMLIPKPYLCHAEPAWEGGCCGRQVAGSAVRCGIRGTEDSFRSGGCGPPRGAAAAAGHARAGVLQVGSDSNLVPDACVFPLFGAQNCVSNCGPSRGATGAAADACAGVLQVTNSSFFSAVKGLHAMRQHSRELALPICQSRRGFDF